MKRILVFASGTSMGGGSGFGQMARRIQKDRLEMEIVAVVSNHPAGGVRQLADQHAILFRHFPAPWDLAGYQALADAFKPDLVVCSGWLKFVLGLTALNIHPGLLPQTAGLHGQQVHEKTLELFRQGAIRQTAVTMHFIPQELEKNPNRYDTGPIVFQRPVTIALDDTVESLASRVNWVEHHCQTCVTNWVAQGLISWDGQHPASLKFPEDYPYLPSSE